MEPLAIVYALHTPEELILYSNIAHWIEGAIFFAVAVIALLQALGYWRNRPYLWPGLILAAGLFLPLFAFSHHVGEIGLTWKATIGDPQQRQHMVMAVLMVIAGLGEIIRVRRPGSPWKFALPTALFAIGILFLTHPQHGTSEAVMRASSIHTYLGSVLVLSGVLRGMEMVWGSRYKLLSFLWLFFLIIAATLLISYREPQGAYQADLMQTVPQTEQGSHMR